MSQDWFHQTLSSESVSAVMQNKDLFNAVMFLRTASETKIQVCKYAKTDRAEGVSFCTEHGAVILGLGAELNGKCSVWMMPSGASGASIPLRESVRATTLVAAAKKFVTLPHRKALRTRSRTLIDLKSPLPLYRQLRSLKLVLS